MDNNTPVANNATPAPEAQTVDSNAWQGGLAAYKTVINRWQQHRQPVMYFIGIFLVAYVLDALVTLNDSAVADDSFASAFSSGGGMFSFIASLLTLLAAPTLALAIADNKPFTFGSLFKTTASRYIAGLLSVIVAGLVLLVGALAILIPLIWFIPWFSMNLLAVVDKEAGPVNALRISRRLVKGNIGKVWGLIGFSLLFSLVPFLIAGAAHEVVAAIFLAATSVVTLAYTCGLALLYRWLQKNNASATVVEAPAAAPAAPAQAQTPTQTPAA